MSLVFSSGSYIHVMIREQRFCFLLCFLRLRAIAWTIKKETRATRVCCGHSTSLKRTWPRKLCTVARASMSCRRESVFSWRHWTSRTKRRLVHEGSTATPAQLAAALCSENNYLQQLREFLILSIFLSSFSFWQFRLCRDQKVGADSKKTVKKL
jgi:hypothetical protein